MKKMSEFLDLPVEPAFRETQVILTGKRRAIVENYRNLQRYTREEIIIVIHGKRLEISCYTAFEMCVCGRIESILLEEGKKK